MYYAFGDTDVYAICDMPDNASATAASLLINASGAVRLNLTPLMTPEDVDAAAARRPRIASRDLTTAPTSPTGDVESALI